MSNLLNTIKLALQKEIIISMLILENKKIENYGHLGGTVS